MIEGLYIHIPFCEQICIYCDFHKEIAKAKKKADYIKRLIESLDQHKDQLKHLKTIYIGGGTPSNIEDALLETLLKKIAENVNLKAILEYTIESNPNDVSKEKAILYKKYGINRVSLGVQSFDDQILKRMNRSHQASDIPRSIAFLRDVGIDNISIDLIFGFHKQSLKQVNEDLKKALALKIPHISYYALILEEKSIMHYLIEQGKMGIVDEDLDYLMYNSIIKTLKENKYEHYEISNFAKAGYASKHNLLYWQQADYLGLGSGAHSYVNKERFFLAPNVQKYIQSMRDEDCIEVYPTYELEDALLFGLRVLKGLHVPTIEAKVGCQLFEEYPILQSFIKEGLLAYEKEYLKLTDKGLMLANNVFAGIMEEHHD
jgi:oxygen-independent coproporphyrinogen-3 oxidase